MLLPPVGQSWGVQRAEAPARSRGQLLSIPPPGPQEGWLASSKGSEDGMLLSSRSALEQLASHSEGELLGHGASKLLLRPFNF